ncbi:TIM barrel protein [Aliiglaciecola sp. LCG003]|uniref:TIM barrel protein n=1 Tax=Aliiglaciecola sp. LCG003 TaxID=3053655 RepID=UPI00257240AA|nr:TIM barrel protein [Aliiglaciecola sp. LCG003]WJG10864.1 TIM barrel protein [Aliiglaciecola sp. LCG003]
MTATLPPSINFTTPTTKQPIDRRRFLKVSAATLGMAALPGSLAFASNAPTKVGLQLYTLRDMMAVSVPATLKLVAAVGYKELEFAGYFEHKPSEIRKLLQGEGLTAPSAHISLETFDNGVNGVIDHALEVGHKFVVLPYLSEEQRGKDIDTYKRLAERLNIIGTACSKAGLTLAYHNHAFEFEMRNGQLPFDVLLNETDANLLAMEMDLYWMVKAQQDPLVYFKQYPGRFKLWHVKDMDKAGNFADVGTGTIDFKVIFAQSKLAGVEHFFVERDKTDNKLQTIQQGYKALAALRAG